MYCGPPNQKFGWAIAPLSPAHLQPSPWWRGIQPRCWTVCGGEFRLRNDLDCVGWGFKLYSLSLSLSGEREPRTCKPCRLPLTVKPMGLYTGHARHSFSSSVSHVLQTCLNVWTVILPSTSSKQVILLSPAPTFSLIVLIIVFNLFSYLTFFHFHILLFVDCCLVFAFTS